MRLIVNISGFGTSVIAKLVKSNVKRNLFYTIKDRVIEEQVINGITHRRQQKVKVYGFDSSKSGRGELFELISDRVEYHKDKIIDSRIYEELCALKMDIKGRIDHPVGGHDDMVIGLALALYVLYRGGDIANNFGITRHMIKTDAEIDEEIYDVTRDAEVISDKITTIDNAKESQVDEQLKILDSAPGKMSYEEWMQAESAKDMDAMRKILATKEGKDAFINKYHLDPEAITDMNNGLFDTAGIINDFYVNNGSAKQDYDPGCGNLFSQFMKVMNAR